MKLDFITHKIELNHKTMNIIGMESADLNKGRYVYVIETPKDYSIKYRNATSNICYIGRQADRGVGSRINGHVKNWISKFLILTQSHGHFSIHQCFPRRRGDIDAFKEVEAFLLAEFKEIFGQRPLFNKRSESERKDYEISLAKPIFAKRRVAGRIDATSGIDDRARID